MANPYQSLNYNPGNAGPVWIAPPLGQVLTPITTAVGALVKTGKGALIGLSINTPQAGATAAVYDGVDNTGTLLGTFSLAAQNVLPIGWGFTTGLYIVTTGVTPANITVSSI